MIGWPVPSPPGDTDWDTDWPIWFEGWVSRRKKAIALYARKLLQGWGVTQVAEKHLADAAQLALASVDNRVRRKGPGWFHDAFIGELPFLDYTAKSIAHEHIRLGRKEQDYRSRVDPVSPLPPAEEEVGTHLSLAELEDGASQHALEGAETRVDYLERQAKHIRTALRGWWSGKTPDEIAAGLDVGDNGPAAHEVFVAILLRYRADTAEIVKAASAASGDPRDPCQDRGVARAYIQAWILATEKFPPGSGGRGYSAGGLAMLVASRAATPLGEDPETFGEISARLGRPTSAVERRYQRLCDDERNAWIRLITINRRPPGNPH